MRLDIQHSVDIVDKFDTFIYKSYHFIFVHHFSFYTRVHLIFLLHVDDINLSDAD